MAFWKRKSRGSFAPASNDRLAVLYLGQHPVADNSGLDHASSALDILYRNYKDDKEQAQRVSVEIIVNGLLINKIKGFSPPSENFGSGDSRTLLAAAKMYFGATDPARPKVFFVVKRDDEEGTNVRDKYECHAFLCDSSNAARQLTLQLIDMFNNIGDADTKLAYRKSFDYATTRSNSQQIRDKGLLRSQSLNLQRSRGRPEAVSTLKITMNVEHGPQLGLINEANNNSEIARIIAQREGSGPGQPATRSLSARQQGKDVSTRTTVAETRLPASTQTEDSSKYDKMSSSESDAINTDPIVAFNPNKPESPNKLLREAQVSSIKEQQQAPSPSPKQSPKERKVAAKKAEDSKENQQVEVETPLERANKRKSVRFADGAEII